MLTEDRIRQIFREEFSRSAVPDRMVSGREACSILGVSPPTLHKLVKSGRVRAYIFENVTKYRWSELMTAGRFKYQKVT